MITFLEWAVSLLCCLIVAIGFWLISDNADVEPEDDSSETDDIG